MSKPDWLTLTPTEGSGDAVLTNTTQPHTGRGTRQGVVTYNAKYLGEVSYNVEQAGLPVFARFTSDPQTIDAAETTLPKVTITGESNYAALPVTIQPHPYIFYEWENFQVNGEVSTNDPIPDDPGATSQFNFSFDFGLAEQYTGAYNSLVRVGVAPGVYQDLPVLAQEIIPTIAPRNNLPAYSPVVDIPIENCNASQLDFFWGSPLDTSINPTLVVGPSIVWGTDVTINNAPYKRFIIPEHLAYSAWSGTLTVRLTSNTNENSTQTKVLQIAFLYNRTGATRRVNAGFTLQRPTISLDPTSAIRPGSAAGYTTFQVITNSSGTINFTPDEFVTSITPTSFVSPGATIRVNYSKNPTTTARSAFIYASISPNQSPYFTLTQQGAPQEMTISPSSASIPAAGGDTKLTVTSNTSWETSAYDWVTISPATGGLGETAVTITVGPNPTVNARSVNVSVYTVGGSTSIRRYFIISQPGQTPYLTLGQPEVNFGENGGTSTVRVNSNVDWEVTG